MFSRLIDMPARRTLNTSGLPSNAGSGNVSPRPAVDFFANRAPTLISRDSSVEYGWPLPCSRSATKTPISSISTMARGIDVDCPAALDAVMKGQPASSKGVWRWRLPTFAASCGLVDQTSPYRRGSKPAFSMISAAMSGDTGLGLGCCCFCFSIKDAAHRPRAALQRRRISPGVGLMRGLSRFHWRRAQITFSRVQSCNSSHHQASCAALISSASCGWK